MGPHSLVRCTTCLRPLPGERLEAAVVLLDGELDGLAVGVEADGELRLAARVGHADQVPAPPRLRVGAVPEGRHEGELLGQALVEDPPVEDRNGIVIIGICILSSIGFQKYMCSCAQID